MEDETASHTQTMTQPVAILGKRPTRKYPDRNCVCITFKPGSVVAAKAPSKAAAAAAEVAAADSGPPGGVEESSF